MIPKCWNNDMADFLSALDSSMSIFGYMIIIGAEYDLNDYESWRCVSYWMIQQGIL